MMRRAWLAVAISLLWAHAAGAQGLPAVGSRLPNITFEDLEGREVRLRSFLGRPVLILYEDRTTAAWNRALKDHLVAMARRKEMPPRLLVLPIVDLRAFRAWPARPIALAQLRARSKELGKPLWADWSGLVAGALGVAGPGPAVVVLLDVRQRVLWAGAGRLDAREVRELLGVLGSLRGPAPDIDEALNSAKRADPPAPTGTAGSMVELPASPDAVSGRDQAGPEVPEEGGGGRGPETDRATPRSPPEVPREAGDGLDEIPLPPFVIPLGVPGPGMPRRWLPSPVRQALEMGPGMT